MEGTARTLRQSARRSALLGLRAGYAFRGTSRRADAQPGVTVLLLHYTPPDLLTRLLSFVDARRSMVVGFDEAMQALRAGECHRPMIALSFDDGFSSNLSAARELSARGISACFYVPTEVIGLAQPDVDRFFRRPQPEGVLSWRELEQMRAAGHVVGSHCKQHRALSGLSDAEAEDQVKGSVGELRRRLGPTHHFAWPFGSLSHAPVDAVRRWCAEIDVLPASGVRGRNTEPMMRRRGFLSRDAVDLRWLPTDYSVFVARSFNRLPA